VIDTDARKTYRKPPYAFYRLSQPKPKPKSWHCVTQITPGEPSDSALCGPACAFALQKRQHQTSEGVRDPSVQPIIWIVEGVKP
jgi:hypothetical protein